MADVQAPHGSVIEPLDARASDKDALVGRLDELLERYLNTLDEYQKLGQQLSKHLSDGYFSLAQANFQNRSTSTRYGQDSYDERMQATRKIIISTDQYDITQSRIHFSTASSLEKTSGTASPSTSPPSTSPAQEKQDDEVPSDTTDANPSSEPLDSEPAPDTKPEHDQPADDPNPPKDPLRMFGILVPQVLRDAQASFVGAVDGPIPRLATVARDLRMQEIDIGRVRKQIKKL